MRGKRLVGVHVTVLGVVQDMVEVTFSCDPLPNLDRRSIKEHHHTVGIRIVGPSGEGPFLFL